MGETDSVKGMIGVKLVDQVFFSIVVPLCAICLFRFFEYWNIGCIKWINIIAGTTFGIYLIHDSYISRSLIWYTILQVDTVLYASPFFPLYAVLGILGVFTGCALIDLGRQRWVEPWMTKRFQSLVNHMKIYLMSDHSLL